MCWRVGSSSNKIPQFQMKASYVPEFLSHPHHYFGGPLSHHVSDYRLLYFGSGMPTMTRLQFKGITKHC